MSSTDALKKGLEKRKNLEEKRFYRLTGSLIVYYYRSINEAEMIKCFPTIVHIIAGYGGYLNFNRKNS